MTDEPVDETPADETPADDAADTLGAFIRAQREIANLSLRQLSGMAEISNAYLSQIERDLHAPSIRVIKNVSTALGLAPELLLAHAGLLDDDDAREQSVSTEEAIRADQHLSADEKQALLAVYRSYRAAKN